MGVRTDVWAADARHLDELHAEERVAVQRAVSTRQVEFATGRALLRMLLDTPAAIPIGAVRVRHSCPAAWSRTLAHDAELVAAAVAPVGHVTALGIDLEPSGPMSAAEAAVVLRPEEEGIDPRLAFVLKEAAYKAWSTLGGELLDFHDVQLAVDGDRYAADILDRSVRLSGRFGPSPDGGSRSWCAER